MNTDAIWDYPQPFTLNTRVTASDIDGLQHTNNTVYVKWCEQVAWQHSESLGLDIASYQQLDRAMAITRSEYDYLAASREGDDVVVATWIINWDGKLTMQRRFQVLRPADGRTLLRGAMRFACIELSTGKPRRMPKEFIQGYSPAIINTGPN
ncbi:MAG: thioesterase family protein [Halieaceae bacterium]